jgi:hypothetical protein
MESFAFNWRNKIIMKKEVEFEKGLRVIVRITKNYYNMGFVEDALADGNAFLVLLDNGELIAAASKNVRAIAKG